MAVCGPTLLSTGGDCSIGVWALGTWSHLQPLVRVSEHVPDAGWGSCLAVSGSMLLCGDECLDEESGFVVVLDSDTLTCQHSLRLDYSVERLLSVPGEVWGTLGNHSVVVWGKAERGEGSSMREAGRA